ncbi:hypothetical protein T4C_10067 [Trichinella pseudospiralis]|uniref:Uncharacterized protein n=1 Tax=Trichinella pseudospiralis TaxID=6337 RepID=A0A0V1JK44_TRIPS|nr:hypothetical protein T4C_10067 [Trichinella pseudospiralis]
MCSAPTLCHGPTFLVESNAIAAMWTFQESSPEAHCVQAGQESAPTFWYCFLGQTATSKSNSATVSKHRATCFSRSGEFCNHYKEFYAVQAVNFLPYMYRQKYHIA